MYFCLGFFFFCSNTIVIILRIKYIVTFTIFFCVKVCAQGWNSQLWGLRDKEKLQAPHRPPVPPALSLCTVNS